jgi:hypothetical protein
MLLVAHRTPPTRVGCEELAAAGARVFEADVQIDDQDGIVVSHYLPFGRYLHRDNWRIRRHAPAVRDPRIGDVVALVPDGCLILLDLKEQTTDRRARLVAALSSALPDRSRYRVCGHHTADLDALRTAGFRTWRTARNRRELVALLAAGPLPDDAVSARHTLLSAPVVERLHACAPQVVAWTVNDRRRARQLQAMGVDGVTTDSSEILRALSKLSN